MANTIKPNGVRPNGIKLQLFPFSLRDIAVTWFDSLQVGSMNTWEELVKEYCFAFSIWTKNPSKSQSYKSLTLLIQTCHFG